MAIDPRYLREVAAWVPCVACGRRMLWDGTDRCVCATCQAIVEHWCRGRGAVHESDTPTGGGAAGGRRGAHQVPGAVCPIGRSTLTPTISKEKNLFCLP